MYVVAVPDRPRIRHHQAIRLLLAAGLLLANTNGRRRRNRGLRHARESRCQNRRGNQSLYHLFQPFAVERSTHSVRRC